MSESNQEPQSGKPLRLPLSMLWWLPVLIPLCLIASQFIQGAWFWGLMDDHRMITYPGSVWDRFVLLHNQLLSAGRFYPTFIYHTALFYKVFVNHPLAFFVFRFCEVVLALGVWGYLAYRVTGKKAAAPILIAVTLSFYRFYDAFYFLSTQEILGVLFTGLSLLCLFLSTSRSFEDNQPIRLGPAAAEFVFLLLAFTSKEPFVSAGIAIGLSLVCAWVFMRERKQILILGLVLLFFFCRLRGRA